MKSKNAELNPDVEKCVSRVVENYGTTENFARRVCLAAIKLKLAERGYSIEESVDVIATALVDAEPFKPKGAKKAAPAGEGGRFAQCEKENQEKEDPEAFCASLGQKKFGKKKMGKMAAAGRKDMFRFVLREIMPPPVPVPDEELGMTFIDKTSRENRFFKQRDDCTANKIKVFSEENPEWEQKQVVAAAMNWCRQQGGADLSFDWVFKKFLDEKCSVNDSLSGTLSVIFDCEAATAEESTSVCYKMENMRETEDEYIVPVVIAAAMVQHYPSLGQHLAKLPENLKAFSVMNYKTGEESDTLPIFEHHPLNEVPSLEVGYVTDLRYQPEKRRIVGILHAIKKRISDVLRDFFERGEQFGVSIGFGYTEGPSGIYDDVEYDAAQENIVLTHLAVFANGEATGRCPLDFCGVGKSIDGIVALVLVGVPG